MLLILLHRVLLRLLCPVFTPTFTQESHHLAFQVLVLPSGADYLTTFQRRTQEDTACGQEAGADWSPSIPMTTPPVTSFQRLSGWMQQIPLHMLAGPPCFSFYLICLFLQKDQQYYGNEHQENRRKLNSILLWKERQRASVLLYFK